MKTRSTQTERLASAFQTALHHAFTNTPTVAEHGAEGLLAWGARFLPEHFSKPPSELHRWLADQLAEASATRGVKINALGPRGSAKSTVATLAYVTRCAIEGTEPYIWIVSDTASQARAHLQNVVTELAQNGRLRSTYPAAVGRGSRWRAARVELRNGVTIEAFGVGQRLRGRRRRAERPTLIVCDDLQNERHIASTRQREATFDWFNGALLPAGTQKTNFVHVATALHRDALGMRLADTPGWVSRSFASIITWPTNSELWDEWRAIYSDRQRDDPAEAASAFYVAHRRAMDLGASVLWPESESLYDLMRLRVEGGDAAFEREKQASPIDPSQCEWPGDYFTPDVWFDVWPDKTALRVIALDPSKGGDARNSDYSAFVALAVDQDGLLYVQADLGRRSTPQMVADGVTLCERFRPEAFCVEANQWQQLLADQFVAEFQRRGLIGVTPGELHNHVNKAMRIRRLGPYLSQRRLRFHSECESTRLLVDQLRDFPIGAHDDGPDALEMAIRLAEEVWRNRNRPPADLGF